MYVRSDNEEFMSGDDTNDIIKSLFESFLQRYEENLQNNMRGSDLMVLTFYMMILIKRTYVEVALI